MAAAKKSEETKLNEADQSDPEKPCNSCRQLIPSDASFCFHCQQPQDWRGKLHLSNTVLALIVALASVLSMGLPPVIEAMKDDGPQLVVGSFSVELNPETDLERVRFLVSNTGDTTAAVTHVIIGRVYPNGEFPNKEIPVPLDEQDGVLIKPDSERLTCPIRVVHRLC